MVVIELAGERRAGPDGIRARVGAAALLALLAAVAGLAPVVLVLLAAAVLVAELIVELRSER